MNKKGFTLIEVIITITIILLIAVIAIPTILNMQNSIKMDSYNSKKTVIEAAAVEYGEDHIDDLPNYSCVYVDVQFLIAQGYLVGEGENKNEMVDPRTNSSMLDYQICLNYTSYYRYGEYIYKVKAELSSNIGSIYYYNPGYYYPEKD